MAELRIKTPQFLGDIFSSNIFGCIVGEIFYALKKCKISQQNSSASFAKNLVIKTFYTFKIRISERICLEGDEKLLEL